MKKKYILLFLFVLAIFIGYHIIGKYIVFENIKIYQTAIQDLVKRNYFFSVFIYIVTFIITTASFIPGDVLLSIAGGTFFGFSGGLLYASVATVLGALLGFFIARYFLGNFFQERYKKQLHAFNSLIANKGLVILILVRFIPFLSFTFINSLAALTNVNASVFAVSTLIGMLPNILLYTWIGVNIADIKSPSDLLSKPILFLFTLLAIFLLISYVITRPVKHKILRTNDSV